MYYLFTKHKRFNYVCDEHKPDGISLDCGPGVNISIKYLTYMTRPICHISRNKKKKKNNLFYSKSVSQFLIPSPC